MNSLIRLNTDAQGNAMSGASANLSARFDQALVDFNFYRGDPVSSLNAMIAEAPDFVMARLLKAWLYALAAEPEAMHDARIIVRQARDFKMTEREQSHLAALELLTLGEWTAAAVALDRHSMRWRHDLLALQAGHLVDFYRACAFDLRNRIARTLPDWSPNIPGYSVLLGMYAFGLEEMGEYAKAESVGLSAIEQDPSDCWAHHAVSHVYEMQGRARDGIDWMNKREPWWSNDGNFFQVHNWWHKALFHIDLGQFEEALDLYDGRVRAGKSSVALDLVDASALLWRLSTSGIEIGDRWIEIANAWDVHADGKLYPFNDWHAVMAWLGAGRGANVESLLEQYDTAVGNEVDGWRFRPGRNLILGFLAFQQRRYCEAAEYLYQVRHIANCFGGSHAQRDVIDWTLAEACLRGGLYDEARALGLERGISKPHSPITKRFLHANN